jgi:hypothetical protein
MYCFIVVYTGIGDVVCRTGRPVSGVTVAAELAARCWGYAAQCLTIAQRTENQSDKLTLIKMAQAWVTLAEQMYQAAQDDEPPPEDVH